MPERILALIVLCLLMTPLMKVQPDPRREKQRTQLVLLIAALGLTMIAIRFATFLTGPK